MKYSDKTHFGYQTVSKSEKSAMVKQVFHSVADRYDLMNDLMSLGIHRLWKRYAVCLAAVRPGQYILDLAGGTGDLARLMRRSLHQRGHIVIADINDNMLKVGQSRLLDSEGINNLSFVQCDAELLPFSDDSFHCVTIGFGLRNMTDKSAALSAVRRVLKPGGRVIILDFSKVKKWLEPCYHAWSFGVIPKLGRQITGDKESYRYLVESIRVHPDQNELLKLMSAAGFEQCEYFNLSGGISVVHRGYKLC